MSEPRDVASQVEAIAESRRDPLPRGAPRPVVRRVPRASSSSSPCATRATRAATCATSSTTTARPRCATRGASPRASSCSTCPGSTPRARARCRAARSSGRSTCRRTIYRALSNFVREGRPDRSCSSHGPNGSAKWTIAAVHDGARSSTTRRSTKARSTASTGCSPRRRRCAGRSASAHEQAAARACESYAHLSDDEIDAKLIVEVRDHPLFLIPIADRERLLLEPRTRASARTEPPNDWILRGQLSHKSQQVFEALLSSYHGSYAEVLKHVQVERYFISRRYRIGRRHRRPAAQRRRGRAADHDGPLAAVAAAVAPGGDPLRGQGRARRRRRRPARVQRSARSARSTPSSTCSSRSRRARSPSPRRTCSSTA